MKIENICRQLRAEGVTTVNVNRIKALAGEFATVDAFFSATRGSVMGLWNKLHPDSGRSLGKGFFDAYDRALAIWKRGDEPRPQPKPTEDMSWLGHELTQEEIKKVLDFMELYQVESMSFARIVTLLDLTGAGGRKDA